MLARSWVVELNSGHRQCESFDEVLQLIDEGQELVHGVLFVSYDGGPRPWWKRFLGGSARYSYGFAALEWIGEFGSLIFYDKNWTEYRVLDHDFRVQPSDDERLQIAHGEKQPCPLDECMLKRRAFDALREALRTDKNPKWVSYRVVG